MKIEIEATELLTVLDGVQVRAWRGRTERGTECVVFVHRVAVDPRGDFTQFEQELRECLPPGRTVSLRHIL